MKLRGLKEDFEEEVNKSFKGIELCTIYPENKNGNDALNKLKLNFLIYRKHC